MRVVYIGGTGEISAACVQRSVDEGQEVTVFNRGISDASLPSGVKRIRGDIEEESSVAFLSEQKFDVICQFLGFEPGQVEKDLRVFSGHCAQYVFISSASCYHKPVRTAIITEDVPLENPFSEYSHNKILCEQKLDEAMEKKKLNVTVVRPSHTFRKRYPGGLASSTDWAWRILNEKPIPIQGDGTSLWTYTHASDFAVPFVGLLGNEKAFNDHFHITRHLEAFTWNDIFEEMGRSLGGRTKIVHVPTDTLLRYNRDWEAGLWGDKSWSKVFDNSKVMGVVGPFECKVGLSDGLAGVAEHVKPLMDDYEPDPEVHDLLDRICEDQEGLGGIESV